MSNEHSNGHHHDTTEENHSKPCCPMHDAEAQAAAGAEFDKHFGWVYSKQIIVDTEYPLAGIDDLGAAFLAGSSESL